MTRFVVLAAAAVIIYLAGLYFVQRSLLYPIPQRQPNVANSGAEIVRLAVPGASTYALFLPARGALGPSPLLIFSHGNAEIAADSISDFKEATAWASALLIEYPGYGGAGGAPTERSITEAMRAGYDWAVRDSRCSR